MPKPNLIDRALAQLAPKVALRRLRTRAAFEVLATRKYEGAGRGRRTEGWRTSGTSASAEVVGQQKSLRDRSRDLVRNNPYASRAVASISQNVVGRGIKAQAMSPSESLNRQVEEVWREWSEDTSCETSGQLNFAGIQALAMRTIVESGEVLIRRRNRKERDRLPVPLQLELLEPDFLDESRDRVFSTPQVGRVIGGIQYDATASVEGYWLHKDHPGDIYRPGAGRDSKLVRAAEIAHAFRVDRTGQPRGIPWVAPAMLRLRDLDEYEDAQLLRQKIAACYAAFITDVEGETAAQSSIPDSIEPGMIEALPPGREVRFADPPGVEGFDTYLTANLRAVAVAYGVSYESLVGDYSKVNFSSGRMGHLEYQRNIESWRWNMLIPRVCVPIWAWFIEQAVAAGRLPEAALVVRAKWTAPRREMVDPGKEIGAMKEAIRNGLMSLPGAMREHGHDPDELLMEIAETNEKLDELGITLDSDPRVGPATQDPTPEAKPEEEEDEEEEEEPEENEEEPLNEESEDG